MVNSEKEDWTGTWFLSPKSVHCRSFRDAITGVYLIKAMSSAEEEEIRHGTFLIVKGIPCSPDNRRGQGGGNSLLNNTQ